MRPRMAPLGTGRRPVSSPPPPAPATLSDMRGRKLSDAAAREVGERLQGIVDDVCRATSDGEFSEVGAP
jgi:hypothetical protein